MRLKIAEIKKKKAKLRSSSSGSILVQVAKGLVIYLATLGQGIAMAQQVRNMSNSGSRRNNQIDSKAPLFLNSQVNTGIKHTNTLTMHQRELPPNLPNPNHPQPRLSKLAVEEKFKVSLRAYRTIHPADILAKTGIQVSPHAGGSRYERASVEKLKRASGTSATGILRTPLLSAPYRARALTDPFYSLFISDEYLADPSNYSIRMAEILVYQAMIQANTPEEIYFTNQAHAEISKLDFPNDLRQALAAYQKRLISAYSVSNAGLCKEIQEGGGLYSQWSAPDLFECQQIAIKMDHKATNKFLQENPTVEPRLEKEAVENQNEYASGTLALIAMSRENYILGLALDIQRILQYRKCTSVNRLYQFCIRQLEKLLAAPHIELSDIELISEIRFLDPYFEKRKLTSNEKVILEKYAITVALAKKKAISSKKRNPSLLEQNPKNYFSSLKDNIGTYIPQIMIALVTLFFILKLTRNLLIKKNNKPTILSIKNNREPPTVKVEEKKLTKRNTSKKKSACVRNHENNTPILRKNELSAVIESKESIKRTKYDMNVRKLSNFKKIATKLDIIPNTVKERLSILEGSLSDLLSQEAHLLAHPRAKDKDEHDYLCQKKKNLAHQIETKRKSIENHKLTLSTYYQFFRVLDEASAANYSFLDAEKINLAIKFLSVSFKKLEIVADEFLFDLNIIIREEHEKYFSHIKTLDNLRVRTWKLVKPITSQLERQLKDLKKIAMENNSLEALAELESATNNLLSALSDLTYLVNIDCQKMDLAELSSHVERAIEAEKIFDPNNPLRQDVEHCYLDAQKIVEGYSPRTRRRSDSQEHTQSLRKLFFTETSEVESTSEETDQNYTSSDDELLSLH